MDADRTAITLRRHVVGLRESHPLASLNPLGIGGVTDYFATAASTVELASAVTGALAAGIPYLVLGSGTRVLFSDGGFPGLVIMNQARALAVDASRSQAVVDCGVELSKAVTELAGRGFGGFIPLYGQLGTVGGALYDNQPLLSALRQVTALMPPNRPQAEPTLVRQSPSWARSSALRANPSPVLLTAVLQLTSNRSDELVERIRRQAAMVQRRPLRALGPIFQAPDSGSLQRLLEAAEVGRLAGTGCVVQGGNFIVARGRGITARSVRELVEAMAERIEHRTGIRLLSRYEYVGVW
jgi:UDP-N-acetylmuramate dehydrogenase